MARLTSRRGQTEAGSHRKEAVAAGKERAWHAMARATRVHDTEGRWRGAAAGAAVEEELVAAATAAAAAPAPVPVAPLPCSCCRGLRAGCPPRRRSGNGCCTSEEQTRPRVPRQWTVFHIATHSGFFVVGY